MKIGFTLDKFIIGPGLPGIDKVCYHTIRELADLEGIEVLLFQDKYKETGEFGRFHLVRFPSPRDLPLVRGKTHEGTRGGGDGRFYPPSAMRLMLKDYLKGRTIRRSDIDILHYPTHLERPYRLRGIVSVMTFHDLVPLIFEKMSTKRIRWEMQELLKKIHRVDHFISVSLKTKEDMIEYLGVREDDISVVYHGISSHYRPVGAAAIRQTVSDGKPYILFVGTVEPRKNLVTLLRAFAGLREEVCLVISGHLGWGSEEVTRTIDELDLRNRVRFTGYTKEEDMPALYSGAELFVFPSWYEGFGLPPMEAMACGTVVASSTGGSLPEVLGDAALYFDPSDVEGMKHSMETLLTSEDLKSNLTARGLERAKKFTWRNSAMEVIDVYRKLIQEDR